MLPARGKATACDARVGAMAAPATASHERRLPYALEGETVTSDGVSVTVALRAWSPVLSSGRGLRWDLWKLVSCLGWDLTKKYGQLNDRIRDFRAEIGNFFEKVGLVWKEPHYAPSLRSRQAFKRTSEELLLDTEEDYWVSTAGCLAFVLFAYRHRRAASARVRITAVFRYFLAKTLAAEKVPNLGVKDWPRACLQRCQAQATDDGVCEHLDGGRLRQLPADVPPQHRLSDALCRTSVLIDDCPAAKAWLTDIIPTLADAIEIDVQTWGEGDVRKWKHARLMAGALKHKRVDTDVRDYVVHHSFTKEGAKSSSQASAAVFGAATAKQLQEARMWEAKFVQEHMALQALETGSIRTLSVCMDGTPVGWPKRETLFVLAWAPEVKKTFIGTPQD